MPRSRSPPPRRYSRSPLLRRDGCPDRDDDGYGSRGGYGRGGGGGRRWSRSPPPRRGSRRDYDDRPRDSGYTRDRKPLPSPPRPGPSRVKRESSRAASAGLGADDDAPPVNLEPNFAPSGLLAAETNSKNGVALKYHEPPEARKPAGGEQWRLYVFKGEEQLDLLHIYSQSAYLVGRDKIVVDLPLDHPSISKQHAVLQYRQVVERNEFGDSKTVVKPFVIDLDSTNGTTVNGAEVPKSRFYELRSGDVIRFGQSTREFVLLCDKS